jgi:hypothetical protein
LHGLDQSITYTIKVHSNSVDEAIEQEAGDLDDEEERRRRARRGGGTIRRKSRVTRQRSYDDEIKTAAAMAGGGAQPTHPDTGLGLPVQLPRRASAYDVYAAPGASGLNAMAIAAAQQRASMSAQGIFTKFITLDKKTHSCPCRKLAPLI